MDSAAATCCYCDMLCAQTNPDTIAHLGCSLSLPTLSGLHGFSTAAGGSGSRSHHFTASSSTANIQGYCLSAAEAKEYSLSRLTLLLRADWGFSRRLTQGCGRLSSFRPAMSFRYQDEIVEKDQSNPRSPSYSTRLRSRPPALPLPPLLIPSPSANSPSWVFIFHLSNPPTSPSNRQRTVTKRKPPSVLWLALLAWCWI